MSGLGHAFKEWAVICKALAEGRQAIVLRKGGIAEKTGEFQVEHTRFWLYPTYVHQQRDGVTADVLPLLEQAEAERPPQGVVRLTHFAETAGVYHLHNLAAALLLGGMHSWSAATVKSRFEYKRPGLYRAAGARLQGGASRSICRRRRTTPAAAAGSNWSANCRRTGRRRCLSDEAYQEVLEPAGPAVKADGAGVK